MATLAFVLLFVLLGLGAFFLAMRGGGQSARERIQARSRRGVKGMTLVFLLSLGLLGIAVPAAVIATETSRDSIPEANIKELTELQQRGRELFGLRCKNCHTLAAAKATARVGPNLDDLRPPKALVLDAIRKGRARGNGNMAAGLVQGEDAEAVAQFVAVAVGNPPE